MHRTLWTASLALVLLTPAPSSSLLGRLWELVSGAPVSTIQPKEGSTWDPNGLAAPAPLSEEGSTWDPSGRS